MPQLYYVDFSQDLSQHAFRHVADPSYLVFPSRVAAQSAWRSFLPGWQLQNAQFLSMEDFRGLLFVPSLPELQDEKRLLCLWQVLTEDDRKAFNLYGYQDIISWGGRFLDFFVEMQDELVSVEYLAHEAPLEIAMREWQEEHLTRIWISGSVIWISSPGRALQTRCFICSRMPCACQTFLAGWYL